MANPKTLESTSKEYKRLEAAAKMLEAVSPNGAQYDVQVIYFDFGQNWFWTTIVRSGWRECQVLSPRQWEQIIEADSIERLAAAIQDVRDGKYFADR